MPAQDRANISTLANLVAGQLRCGLRLSGSIILVCEPAINVNHLCTSRNIELVLCSTRRTLNHSYAWTLGQRDLHSILTTDWAGENRGKFFLHDSDDTPTSTTHANPAERMGDLTLISTFHVSFVKLSSKRYQRERRIFRDTKLYPVQRFRRWSPNSLKHPSIGPLLGLETTSLRG